MVLFLNAFWSTDPFTALVVREFTLDNFVELFTTSVYRTVTLRTVVMAALVTATCIVLAYPDRVLHGQGRLAAETQRPCRRRPDAVVGELSHQGLLVATDPVRGGVLDWALGAVRAPGPGFGDVAVWLIFTYLWLPFMILPIYAGLERIPSSLLEASADLGGHGWIPSGG